MTERFEITFTQRPWQRPMIARFKAQVRHGIVIAHRRAGKDRGSLRVELRKMLEEPMEVWHGLPEQEHARKVVWDAITGQGDRLIDVAFPAQLRRRTINDEMKIELVNGSLWRLVGMDRINALMGGNPKHVTYSEFAMTNPRSRQLIRPILAENGGSELIITTPRGYNHAYDTLMLAKEHPESWYWGVHPVSETRLISDESLAEERRDMPDELYRQEYECDFSAANVGSVLGRYIEDADKEGRLAVPDLYDSGMSVNVSSDIGFRDAAAWWFWQPVIGGIHVIDYVEDSGMDAEEWCARLKLMPYDFGRIWLPHDARAKTFTSRRSAVETFLQSFGSEHVGLTPQTTIADRINAGRLLARRCKWAGACKDGVHVLRNWQFKWDEERKEFSKEPDHNWASHGGDAFSYLGVVALESKPAKPKPGPVVYDQPAHHAFSLEQLYTAREQNRGGRHF